MPAKKPEGLRDILETLMGAKKGAGRPRGATAQASAIMSKAPTKEKTIQVAAKTGKAIGKGAAGAAKAAFGDPDKGWKNVAYNTGTWLIPYGKGFKVVNKAVKGAKYYKTAKVGRGALKVGMVIGADSVLSKGINSMPDKKKIPRK
jgi:hypothetical protein